MATLQAHRAALLAVPEASSSNLALMNGKTFVGNSVRSLRPQGRPAGSIRLQVQAVASPVKPAAPARKSSAPTISAEDAKMLYRDMVLAREFEEMCAQMYYRGKMFGFVHLYSGQEAVSTGEKLGVNLTPTPTPQCASLAGALALTGVSEGVGGPAFPIPGSMVPSYLPHLGWGHSG